MRRAALIMGLGAFAGALAGLLECVHLTWVAREQFVSSRELWLALRSALGINAGLGALLGASIAAACALAASAAPLLGSDHRVGHGRMIAIVAAPLFGASFWQLSSGPRVRDLPARFPAIVALALLTATALAILLPRLFRLRSSNCSVRVAVAAGLVGIGAGAYAVDARILVRLYPVFHLWLGLLCVGALIAMLALLTWTRLAAFRSAPWIAIAAALSALGGSANAVRFLLTTQNMRAVLMERAPGTTRALDLARMFGARPPTAREMVEQNVPPPSLQVDMRDLPSVDMEGRDLLVITIDALRADHLGVYGYGRPTSPRMDEIARRAVTFERAYTPTPQTSYALTSLLTGKYVRSLVRLGQPPSSETIAHSLRARGVATAAFFTDAVFFIDRENFTAFEEDRFGFEYTKMHPLDAQPRIAQVHEYMLERRRQEEDRPGSLFVWVHFFEPHEPYDPHSAYQFGDRDIDRYDAEIAVVDQAIGQLVDDMTRLRGEPAIVITADHAEEFAEHGGRYHGTTLYDEQARVPLIMSLPGVEPRRVREPVQLVDIVPTLLGLYGIPVSARVRGVDLRPLLFGRPLRTRAFSETRGMRMIVEGGLKLICDSEQDLCKLYDLDADPGEQHNLVDAEPSRVSTLKRALVAWAGSHARFEAQPVGSGSGGTWPAPIRLGLLGDGSAVPDLIGLLRDANPVLRAKAAQVLGPLGSPEAIGPLLALRADASAEVASAAALSLSELGEQRGAEGARAVLRDLEADRALRWRAALALAGLGDESVSETLKAMVLEPEAPVDTRLSAIAALGRLRDRSALPLLVSRLDVVREKEAIVAALAAIGDRRSVPVLRRVMLEDPYATIRSRAAAALGRLGDRSACPSLRRALSAREPVQGALAALVTLSGARDLREDALDEWRCDADGCALPAHGGRLPLPSFGHAPVRVVVWVHGGGDGGRLLVGGIAADIRTGDQELVFDLGPGQRDVAIVTEPSDLGVSIRAITTVRPESEPDRL